jgi:hypothetical protein
VGHCRKDPASDCEHRERIVLRKVAPDLALGKELLVHLSVGVLGKSGAGPSIEISTSSPFTKTPISSFACAHPRLIQVSASILQPPSKRACS